MQQIPGVPLKICVDVSTSVMQYVLTAHSAVSRICFRTQLRYKQTRSIPVSKNKRKCATLIHKTFNYRFFNLNFLRKTLVNDQLFRGEETFS